MKIFATRKRKVASGPEASSATPTGSTGPSRTEFKSDPVVEDLLKQDPSTWNAKQRRLVKRYQERQETQAKETPEQQSQATNDTQLKNQVEATPKEASAIPTYSEKNQPADAELAAENSKETSELAEKLERKEADANELLADAEGILGKVACPVAVSKETEVEIDVDNSETATDKDTQEIGDDQDAAPGNADLTNLLARLTSKDRRRLTRKLEREGKIAEVRREAQELLEGKGSSKLSSTESKVEEVEGSNDASKGTDGNVAPKVSAEAASESVQTSKRRRKNNQVDWDTLPEEERIRREEQRRMQQEAAAKRASGEVNSKHKHPLNSERRRANRRKPKWQPASTKK